MLAAFVRVELRTRLPLLDPRLFRLRGFATGSASLFLQFFAMFGFFFVSLQYLQLVLGYSALDAAVALLPMSVVMIPLATVSAAPSPSGTASGWSAPPDWRLGAIGIAVPRNARRRAAATSTSSPAWS